MTFSEFGRRPEENGDARHRPRHRGAAVRDRRPREGRPARRAAEPHQPRRQRQPRADGRLPGGVRDRAAHVAQRRRQGRARQDVLGARRCSQSGPSAPVASTPSPRARATGSRARAARCTGSAAARSSVSLAHVDARSSAARRRRRTRACGSSAPTAGIFSFGDAHIYGSTGGKHLNKPIVGMAATPTGKGYWLVASDGGIFSFGDARFHGSTGRMRLNQPIVGMAATPSGKGYWLVASRRRHLQRSATPSFHGSTGGDAAQQADRRHGRDADAARATGWSHRDGGIFSFGDAKLSRRQGEDAGARRRLSPARRSGNGYWLAARTARSAPSATRPCREASTHRPRAGAQLAAATSRGRRERQELRHAPTCSAGHRAGSRPAGRV